MDVASLLPDPSTVVQGGSLLFLFLVLLRVMYVERREHREEVDRYRARVAELETEARTRAREHELEIDAEITKRRAAEDRRAGRRLKAAGEVDE